MDLTRILGQLAATLTSSGGANTWTGSNAFQSQLSATPVNLGNLGTTPSLNFASGANFYGVANANFTLPLPTGLVAGQAGCIQVTQDATGSRTITYASGWVFAGAQRPALSTAAGAVDVISYLVLPGGTQVAASLNKGFA